MASIESPGWPTALAILANVYASRSGCPDVLGLRGERDFAADGQHDSSDRFNGVSALRWLVETKGSVHDRGPLLGHDSTLVGWPWVVGTHSWSEPTALAVLALKAAGKREHQRTREAVQLLHDRLLPDGGCNYGNTTVLGQTLRPHVAPTGIVLLALHAETDDGRIARSLDYLERQINGETTAVSLSYAVWGLARYCRRLPAATGWLAAAASRRTTQNSPHRMALLLLASAAVDSMRTGSHDRESGVPAEPSSLRCGSAGASPSRSDAVELTPQFQQG
jgi:hypothetical protein